ncbi:MAG: phage holin family protein [Bacteroidales bacterium]
MLKSGFAKVITDMTDSIRKYIEIRLNLAKLDALEKSARILSLLLSAIFLFIIFMLFLFFISLTMAKWLGQLMNSDALGYLIIAVIYLISGIIVLRYRRKLFLGSAIKHLSEIFFEDVKEDENEKD